MGLRERGVPCGTSAGIRRPAIPNFRNFPPYVKGRSASSTCAQSGIPMDQNFRRVSAQARGIALPFIPACGRHPLEQNQK
jgi:hypothetical protein